MTGKHLDPDSADLMAADQLLSEFSLWTPAIMCPTLCWLGLKPWAQKLCKHVNQPEFQGAAQTGLTVTHQNRGNFGLSSTFNEREEFYFSS